MKLKMPISHVTIESRDRIDADRHTVALDYRVAVRIGGNWYIGMTSFDSYTGVSSATWKGVVDGGRGDPQNMSIMDTNIEIRDRFGIEGMGLLYHHILLKLNDCRWYRGMKAYMTYEDAQEALRKIIG